MTSLSSFRCASSLMKCFIITVLTLSIVPIAWAQRRYTVTDLTLPGGQSSVGHSINAFGQVTGCSDSARHPGQNHAFLYVNHRIFDLGTLSGETQSCGAAINNFGRIVGSSGSAVFLYHAGRMTAINALAGASPNAMNTFGQIAGADGEFGFLYSGGILTTLKGLPGDILSVAYGINDWGQVVGMSHTSTSGHFTDYKGFIYSHGKTVALGTLPNGAQSIPMAINNFGQITGSADTGPVHTPFHAFLYSGGKMNDLGTLPGGITSQGMALNHRGQIVGGAGTPSGYSHAFIYQNGRMVDLNTLIPPNSGWTLYVAYGINDAGQITGFGNFHGQNRGFLLTPR